MTRIPAARKVQFDAIGRARKETLRWAGAQRIPLHRIEFIVPFVDTDFSLDVWMFYDTDDNLAAVRGDGRCAAVEQAFLAALTTIGYPPDWLENVVFSSDSHENVERNFEGNYFYRLR